MYTIHRDIRHNILDTYFQLIVDKMGRKHSSIVEQLVGILGITRRPAPWERSGLGGQ